MLHFIGDDGYLEIARQVLDATRRMAKGIEAIPELRLLGQPEMNLVAFTSDTVSVFHIIDEMKTRLPGARADRAVRAAARRARANCRIGRRRTGLRLLRRQ